MSVPIPLADPLTVPARGACGEEDNSFVATIPIRGPATTVNSLPASETTAAETPAAIRSDVDLLSAFVLRREPEALTLIVERYGPMVYRVALRVVDERHLADDIFQATFLVLAQSARKIKHGELLPAWLHGTARNIARRALADRHTEQKQLAQLASQSRSEKGGEMSTSTELDPFEELARRNEQQLLDEELQQLPEASRTPLVLFYLEEKSQSEIAQLMGLSVDAVEGRLRRARQELRQRLIRRGVFLSTVVAAATVLTPSLATAAPATTLVSSTVATALGTTAVGSTVASTTLATGATTAAKLAAQEVAAMSAASKATAILITTAASTTVATGLLFGAIVGSLTLGNGRDVPAMSVAEIAYPLNLVEEGDYSDPFSLESDQPVLLAQVELPASLSEPVDSPVTDDAIRLTRQYDVSDFDADLRKKFVSFYKLGKSVTFQDNIMKIKALQEDHWLYEMALDHYREKRDQEKLSESEFDSVLSTLRKEYAEAPNAAQQNLKTAEKELVDRELTHGRADAGTRDLQRRVDLWKAVVDAIQMSDQSKPSDAPIRPANTPRQEAKPVVYQIADLDIDHKWIALEYARTLDVHVASHESTQSFVVRANDQVHHQITEFIGNLRTAAYAKNTESVRRHLARKLKTHSDNHPALEQLRHLLAQLHRVENEHGELQAAAMNNDPFALHRKLSFYAGVTEEKPAVEGTINAPLDTEESKLVDNRDVKIDTPESSLRLVLNQSRKLTFPDKITKVEGFDSKLLTVTPLAVDTICVEAQAVGETAMIVTGESGKEYRITVLVNTPIVHALHDELVRQKDAEIAKWQQSYRDEQVEKEQILDELARQSKELNERNTRLNQIVDYQRQQLEVWQDQTSGFEVPDGKITNVDAATHTVWLNIGQKDHLRKQATFSVYGKATKGIARGPEDVKAKIEVVEVRETSAIARIIEENRDRPMEVGDLIFSPAWSAGLTESFAIVGQGDLNGDGEMNAKDRRILKDLLDNSGAEIDLEITAEGLREPTDTKLTADTKWLIVGDLGDPTAAVNDPEKLKQILAVQKQHEMLVQEAQEHGIRIVSLKDFLTYLGWKPESRVYIRGGVVPFQLKAGARPPALNALTQAPANLPKPAPVTDEMKQFLTQWDNQNQKITTLHTSFTRFEFDNVFETETRCTGKFYLERPDRWRIDFEPVDAALLAKPAGRTGADGKPFKVMTGESSKWICTGKRIYILNVANKSYDLLEIPPQHLAQNRIGPGPLHSIAGPLPFLFALKAEDAKQLFTLRFGAFHNPLGDKLDVNGKPRRKAIHLVANPIHPGIAKQYSEAEVIFDADTYIPLNLRTINSAGNKETIYVFSQSETKIGIKWGLSNPFRDPLLPGWEQLGTGRWPLIDDLRPNYLWGMLFSDRPIASPETALDPATFAKTIPITEPETEVELPVHDIRLLQFPVAIAKAEIQYEPVLELKPVRGQLDTLHLRAITDGSCQLIVTGTNDAVYRVGIKAGVQPRNRFREIDANEAKAANALETQVSLEFPDNSLKEVCNFITQLHNLPVVLDEEDIKASGASPDLHVTMKASGLTLAEAMRTMLEKVKEPPLDYYIEGGAIHISTVAAMKTKERLLYYRLACLSPEGQATAEKYITPLATSVAPLEGDLLVDASVDIHKKFADYLEGAWRLESQRPARAIDLSE